VLKNNRSVTKGHDLKELQNATEEKRRQIFNTCNRLMLSIYSSDLVVIAQVNGLATAAGCQLVATCDLGIASENSQFATPGVKLGLFCTTPGVAIGRALSNRKKALEMLFTGQPISAQEAMQYGLVNKVVAAGDLSPAAIDMANHITQYSYEVIKMGKRAFINQMSKDIVSAYDYAGGVMVDNMSHPDAKEGITAFLEKRQPNWQ